MSGELFFLMLSIPIGVLLTVAPAWALAIWSAADPGPPRLPCPAPTTGALPSPVASTQHPRACLAVALRCARDYRGAVAAQYHTSELDPMTPMTWLLAGRMRDRFETALLIAIGAVHDWLGAGTPLGGADPRAQLEHERIGETLATLIGALPTFPADADLGRCHYRASELQRICVQLRALSASIDRHRQVALHPPASPYR